MATFPTRMPTSVVYPSNEGKCVYVMLVHSSHQQTKSERSRRCCSLHTGQSALPTL